MPWQSLPWERARLTVASLRPGLVYWNRRPGLLYGLPKPKELDEAGRLKIYYGKTVHSRCINRDFLSRERRTVGGSCL
jgi:hypothetical protein